MSQPPVLPPFDYLPRTRVIFAPGALAKIGELTAELGGKKALVVSDPGIVAAGYTTRAVSYLVAAGVRARVFGAVRENPTTLDVDECVACAREFGANFIIGLGGGSSMDTAKGCNFILTNGGAMSDYWGVGKASKPMLPMICVPTTAGTGSECQSFALISDEKTHVKMACGDPKAAARAALLDPELTVSQPARVTACTAIDAIAHALETLVTNKRNPLSVLFAREAFSLCNGSIERVLASPADVEARGRMQLGAAFAGTAIENSMLGAAHSCANPLTALFNVVHGEAVGVMLPHVVRFNSRRKAVAQFYAEVYDGDLPARLRDLLQMAGLATRLRDLGIKRDDAPRLAAMAATQWTAQFNPRPVTAADFEKLYRAAW
jgi:alcohol dehydrogenase